MKKSALYALLVIAGGAATWGLMTVNRSDAAPTTMPASTGGQPVFGGPTIAGLCVLDRQRVFNTSNVGKEANDRYKDLRAAAQNTVSGEEAKIVGDAKILQGQKASLALAAFTDKLNDINKRYQDLRSEATQRGQALEATRQQVVGQISQAAQPVIVSIYRDRRCGLLVDQSSILAGNPAMNVTDAVIAALDAKGVSVALPAAPAHAHL
ncbi:MAG TPA: OmpH family outer membrane protein [Rhizomicrobium sp.]|jgi:outer membrane protein